MHALRDSKRCDTAAALTAAGLMVPVVRDADPKGRAAIEVKDLAAWARCRRLCLNPCASLHVSVGLLAWAEITASARMVFHCGTLFLQYQAASLC